MALLDDAYFGLVYEEGVTKESLFVKLLEANENLLAVKLDGPTKEDYVWGFRVGFMTFGFKGATEAQLKALEDKAAGTVRGNISNAPSISQKILLAAFQSPEYLQQKQEKYNTLKKRFDIIKNELAAHPEYKESRRASMPKHCARSSSRTTAPAQSCFRALFAWRSAPFRPKNSASCSKIFIIALRK